MRPCSEGVSTVCGRLEQLAQLPEACVHLIYTPPMPPFHSNRNDEVFWGEIKEEYL